jgi:hypothetical protein
MIAIGTAVGVVFLSTIIHIGIREWYQPDVRYEEGSYYRTGDMAVTSLKLQNYGHSDAEKIKVSAYFPEPIVEVTTSKPAILFITESDVKGQKEICGSIARLVQGDSVYVYFAIENPGGPIAEASKNFISEITYNGGIGKTGRPITMITLVILVLEILALIPVGLIFVRRQTHIRLFHDKLNEAILFGISAKRKNLPEKEFDAQVVELFGNLRFGKKTVPKAAKTAYQSTMSRADSQKLNKTKSP